MIHVVRYNFKTPDGAVVVDATSRSSNWSRGLSPFIVGPVKLYGNYESVNFENLWQYSKLYEYYADDDGNPTDRYFKWAQDGWNSKRAERYPMGRGAKPLCSYWDGQKLGYVEARKKIYIPKYSEAVRQTEAFKQLESVYKAENSIYLKDFDAHSLAPGTFSYADLWDNPSIKVGHAYVLAMMLEGSV